MINYIDSYRKKCYTFVKVKTSCVSIKSHYDLQVKNNKRSMNQRCGSFNAKQPLRMFT